MMAYCAREYVGQCGSCFNGTAAMRSVLDALWDGGVGGDDLARLRRWSQVRAIHCRFERAGQFLRLPHISGCRGKESVSRR